MRGLFILFVFLVNLSLYAQSFTINNINYNVTSSANKEVEARWYLGSGGDIILPSLVSNAGVDYTITHIGQYIFSDKNITSVSIPNTVKSIGTGAFSSNKLTSVTLPDSVTTMGDFVFSNNTLLTSIQLSENLESIPYQAFVDSGLTSLIIPNNVTNIGAYSFANSKIKSLVLSENLVSIAEQAFANCSLLAGLTIPGSVKSIGSQAFANCSRLSVLTLEDGITSIGALAFSNSDIKDLILPETIQTLSNQAFDKNPLESVRLLGAVPPVLGNGTFGYNNFDKIHFIVISDAKDVYENDASWGNLSNVTFNVLFDFEGLTYATISSTEAMVLGRSLGNTSTNVIIPSSTTNELKNYTVTAIKNRSFKSNGLTSVSIPATVTSIGSYAFDNNNLTNVNLPDLLKVVEEGVFRDNSLTNIIIPSTVTSIGEGAFKSNKLSSVNLPSSLEIIGKIAFEDNNLTEVDFPDSLKEIEDLAFYRNKLININLPASLTSMGKGVFYVNYYLKTVTVFNENPITLIDDTFYNIESLELYVPSSSSMEVYKNAAVWSSFQHIHLQSYADLIGQEFESGGYIYKILSETEVSLIGKTDENTDLDIVIPSSVIYEAVNYVVTNIGRDAFYNDGIESVEFPNTITSIARGAFKSNKLSSIDLPSSLEVIGKIAFEDNNLTDVSFPESLEEIKDYAFYRNKFRAINLPASLISMGKGVFYVNYYLKTVTVLNENPITLIDDTFYNIESLELYVPSSSSIEVYKNAAVWGSFQHIRLQSYADLISQEFESGGYIYKILSNTEVSLIGKTDENTDLDIVIPSSVIYEAVDYVVTNIGRDAFYNDGIENVEFPNTIISIARGAFKSNKLSSIDLPSSLEVIDEIAFEDNNLTYVGFPESLEEIKDYAFYRNKFRAINLPASLISMGKGVFYVNYYLKTVTVLNENPITLIDDTFYNIGTLELRVSLENAKTAYENALIWQDFGNIIVDGEEQSVPLIDTASIADLKLDLEANFTLNDYKNRLEIQSDTDDAIIERLELYNFSGELIKATNGTSIDLSEVSLGIYVLKVSTDKGVVVKRFLKQ